MNNSVINYPTIPTEIVVHLGPPDEAAENVSLPFVDYIKNVASNEIYPTWPDSAIEANILAQISFALNRIYNEWYPSKGYSFDITSVPAYDQTFKVDSQVFDKISKKVDQIFNNYIYRKGQIQPLSAVYCDGKVTTCNGLSQWGSVSLARQNKTPIEILRYYYGQDIFINTATSVSGIPASWPTYDLTIGATGNNVSTIQRQLNRIARAYPQIPVVSVDGRFGPSTARAVETFQRIFDLPQSGIVDYPTWYKISDIYVGVSKIAEYV